MAIVCVSLQYGLGGRELLRRLNLATCLGGFLEDFHEHSQLDNEYGWFQEMESIMLAAPYHCAL
jgi:hypothetical protein